MGYKLESAKNGALASLLFSIPVALATKGQVNPLKTIGIGAAAGAGLGFTGAAYGEASNYLDERAKFRDLQNKILYDAGATEFVNPNNGNIRHLAAGINGLFSGNNGLGTKSIRAGYIPRVTGGDFADGNTDKLSFKQKAWNTTKKVATSAKNTVDKSLVGEGLLPTNTESPFLNGMNSSLNYTIKGGAYAGVKALDSWTQKHPALYSLTHRAPASFSEDTTIIQKEDLPEDLEHLVCQVKDADDQGLELERVLLLVPEEYKERFLEQFIPCDESPTTSALDVLCQPGDFAFLSKLASGVMKGVSKAADALHLGGVAAKASGVAERTTQKALEKASSKAAEVAEAAASSGAKNATSLLDKAKQAKESLDTFNAAPKRSDYGSGRTFKNAVKEADKTAFREKAGNSTLFDAVTNKIGKKLEVNPDKMQSFKDDIADTVFGAKEGAKNIVKKAGDYQMKREVVKSITNNQNNNNNNQTR